MGSYPADLWDEEDVDYSQPLDRDRERTAEAFQKRGCELGFVPSCLVLQTWLASWCGNANEGRYIDPQLTRQYIADATVGASETSCAAGEAETCEKIGGMFAVGGLVPEDPSRAIAFFQKACSDGRSSSCAAAKRLIRELDEQKRHLEHDSGRLRAEAEEDCHNGDRASCRQLGWFSVRGEGGPVDAKKAIDAFDRSCSGGLALACGDLAWLYTHGENFPRDAIRAVQLRQRACSLGEDDLCSGN
jgi:TPR repeat protein